MGDETGEHLSGIQSDLEPSTKVQKRRRRKEEEKNPQMQSWTENPKEEFQVWNPGGFGTCASPWGFVSVFLQLCLPPQPVSNVPPQGKESFPTFQKTKNEKFFQNIPLQEGLEQSPPQEPKPSQTDFEYFFGSSC